MGRIVQGLLLGANRIFDSEPSCSNNRKGGPINIGLIAAGDGGVILPDLGRDVLQIEEGAEQKL